MTIFINENKNYGKKPVVTVEPGTGSIHNPGSPGGEYLH
jgi:hypothetical protein